MSESSIIKFEKIVKQRHNLQIGPLDIEIPQGCVTAIVGRNGSGKSTLLAMLMGFVHPETGTMLIDGRSYDASQDKGWKRRIGYVPELPNPEDDDQTPEQLAKQSAYWYPTWDWQYFQKLVARYEIDLHTKLNKMSKGMRRKFEIIQAMSHYPDVLLLDEPTSGLDPISWRMMMEDLQYILQDGKHTVVIATHVIEEVKRLADYILFIHGGQVLDMVEKDTLFDAWKEYWLEGVTAEELIGAPGLAKALQEGQVVRAIAYEALKLESFFHENGITPVRIQSIPLDEVMLYRIQMVDERIDRAR